MEGLEYDVEEEEPAAIEEEVAITIQDSVQEEVQSNIEDAFFNHNADGSNVSIPHVEEAQ